MIDLKTIENEINELQNQLWKKKTEYSKAKESNLKEKFGENFGCGNCAYSCCVDVGDCCVYCTKSKCIYCYNYCDEYIPENELSAYIREHHYYDESTLSTLNDFFNVSDIMQHPQLYQMALKVLTLRDEREKDRE